MKLSSMKSKEVHDKWKRVYRTPENARFHEMACHTISEYFGSNPDSLVLDAGCGTGEKTMQLVRHGHEVIGMDIALVALKEAQAKSQLLTYSNKINWIQSNLLNLAFLDATFDAIVIWGVLMHVFELENAVAELCRVLKPGGKIVIYDANPKSLDIKFMTLLKNLRGDNKSKHTDLGIENWFGTHNGSVLVRWTYFSALKELFYKYGVNLNRRRAGQLTEMYVYVNQFFLRTMLHKLNHIYFKFFRWYLPAYANLIFGEKRMEFPHTD